MRVFVPGVGYVYFDTLSSHHQLPRIDAVVISHSHYDHLDAGSVASLNARFGGTLRWCVTLNINSLDEPQQVLTPPVGAAVMSLCRFVPLGLMDWLMKTGCENVIELDWWEENCVPGYDDITFVCTPSQHWSKRTALDYNKVLHLLQGYYNPPGLLQCCLF